MAKKLKDDELKLLRRLAKRSISMREDKAAQELLKHGLVGKEWQASDEPPIWSVTEEGKTRLKEIDDVLTDDEQQEWLAWPGARIGDNGPEALHQGEWSEVRDSQARALMQGWRKDRLPISHLLPEQRRRKWFAVHLIQRDIVKYIRCHVKTGGDSEAAVSLRLLEIEYTECGSTIRWAGAQVLALLSVYGLVMAGWWNVVAKAECDMRIVVASGLIATIVSVGIGIQASHAHNYWLLASWRAAEIEEEYRFSSLARSALMYRKNTIDGQGAVSFFHHLYSKNVFPLLILVVHLAAIGASWCFAWVKDSPFCSP